MGLVLFQRSDPHPTHWANPAERCEDNGMEGVPRMPSRRAWAGWQHVPSCAKLAPACSMMRLFTKNETDSVMTGLSDGWLRELGIGAGGFSCCSSSGASDL